MPPPRRLACPTRMRGTSHRAQAHTIRQDAPPRITTHPCPAHPATHPSTSLVMVALARAPRPGSASAWTEGHHRRRRPRRRRRHPRRRPRRHRRQSRHRRRPRRHRRHSHQCRRHRHHHRTTWSRAALAVAPSSPPRANAMPPPRRLACPTRLRMTSHRAQAHTVRQDAPCRTHGSSSMVMVALARAPPG